MKVFTSVRNALVKLWKNEPLRTAVYSVTTAALAYLLAVGVVTQSTESLILTIAGVILVGGSTELARSQVTPLARLTTEVLSALLSAKGVSAPVASAGLVQPTAVTPPNPPAA